ncbi:23 kDa jasmonate-induced protein-like [Durio zibethinus]|uniref:23 kDa jasmonate-induced protein-like n=1 Tax=Durio zibethinus TaxID=66656 RepID=A0A6P5Z6F0_DURZI|nr:23 kDa jasmonate-induced protein-like [Durio zibethinus]
MLDSQNYWHGYGDPPKSIQDQQAGDFKHNTDSEGSIGGVAYLLKGNKLKWIIAWSNAENEPNKVYTEIIEGSQPIDWFQIKASLGKSGNQSSDDNKFGNLSEAVFDQTGPTPTLLATLRPAA